MVIDVRRAAMGVALAMARPYLRLHFTLLGRKTQHAPFPQDVPITEIAGPRTARIVIVGDLAVAGYGVLLSAMALPEQFARAWSARTGRGCTWSTLTRPIFAAGTVAQTRTLTAAARGANGAVIVLGISDALLATSSPNFAAAVEIIVTRIREAAGREIPVVLAALPPMTRFQPLPPLIVSLLANRMRILDHALTDVAVRLPAVVVAPFPQWELGHLYVRNTFSYRAMHHQWGVALAEKLNLAT